MLKNRNNLIMLASTLAIIGVILYVYWTYFYTRVHTDIQKITVQKQDLEKRLGMARDRAQQLERIREEMDGLNLDVVQLEKQLPRGRELPGLLRVFTHRAESFGLLLSN